MNPSAAASDCRTLTPEYVDEEIARIEHSLHSGEPVDIRQINEDIRRLADFMGVETAECAIPPQAEQVAETSSDEAPPPKKRARERKDEIWVHVDPNNICKRCSDHKFECLRSSNPRKLACKGCTKDKKSCRSKDVPSDPPTGSSTAQCEKDFVTAEGCTLEELFRLFLIKTQWDIKRLSEDVGVIKADQAKILSTLARVEDLIFNDRVPASQALRGSDQAPSPKIG